MTSYSNNTYCFSRIFTLNDYQSYCPYDIYHIYKKLLKTYFKVLNEVALDDHDNELSIDNYIPKGIINILINSSHESTNYSLLHVSVNIKLCIDEKLINKHILNVNLYRQLTTQLNDEVQQYYTKLNTEYLEEIKNENNIEKISA